VKSVVFVSPVVLPVPLGAVVPVEGCVPVVAPPPPPLVPFDVVGVVPVPEELPPDELPPLWPLARTDRGG
jgi:hypothetical protein